MMGECQPHHFRQKETNLPAEGFVNEIQKFYIICDVANDLL